MQHSVPQLGHITAFVIACLMLAVVAGCAAAPRQRPIPAGPVDTGPGSLEAVRRQLAGTWELVSFEAFTGRGQSSRVPASGRLTYDEFGNLTIQGQLDDDDGSGRTTLLNMSGRAVIDVVQQRFLILDSEGNLPLDQADFATASPDRFRYYDFAGDRLVLTVKDENGATTALLTWQRP